MDDGTQSKTSAEGCYVALLRGINVGGKNKLPMQKLAALVAGAGCHAVRTYIQSGNVVFRATAARARELPRALAGAIAEHHGLQVPVVTRTAAELRQAVRRNPFLEQPGVEPKSLHVAFLADRPEPEAIAALDPDRSPPDRFEVRGRDIYLCCPNGVARTKLTNAYFDRKLDTVSTLRNWRTVLELVELADVVERGE